jgi:hypothetical protein
MPGFTKNPSLSWSERRRGVVCAVQGMKYPAVLSYN